jgi:cytochrome P450
MYHSFPCLQAEADSILADNDLTYEVLEKLKFTNNVIKETLRLYPPATGVSR